MARSLDGTQWVCTEPNSDTENMKAVITSGDYDPKWGGEQEIEVRFENGMRDVMSYAEFRARFKQLIPAYAR